MNFHGKAGFEKLPTDSTRNVPLLVNVSGMKQHSLSGCVPGQKITGKLLQTIVIKVGMKIDMQLCTLLFLDFLCFLNISVCQSCDTSVHLHKIKMKQPRPYLFLH